jgi:hypothetical protein
MPGPFLAAFKDPVRGPRYVIWSVVAFLALVVVVLLALGITSSRWFCAQACHKVQDDTVLAYEHSSHQKVSCIACHMPVNADPATFLLHKMKALGELMLTVTNRYELPLNPDSELARNDRDMASVQCTQCHDMVVRKVSPSAGIIIDHAKHTAKDIQCTMCHNRVAHKEDFELTLVGNRKHEDFMKMEACFRCHDLKPGAKAPGRCEACHPKDFELKPANHLEVGFYPKGHAKMARARPKYCDMCHDRQGFCVACHGVEMPHPAGFKTGHGAAGKSRPQSCLRCHGTKAGGFEFCNACHHKDGDPSKPWIPQHWIIVRDKGVGPCFACHKNTFCAACHVRGFVPK